MNNQTETESQSETESLRRHIDETKGSWETAPYYDAAENDIDVQWQTLIYPGIQDCDFSRVLELAPGHGRCTAKLLNLARELHIVDVNESCISYCQDRFRDHPGECQIHYYTNDGLSLAMIEDSSITLVYSWDSMVHFEPGLVRMYLLEFSRVLVEGGHAAIHVSNFGSSPEAQPGTNWRDNPHWRSSMSREQLHEFCQDAGLTVRGERLITWAGVPDLDCMALLLKAPR